MRAGSTTGSSDAYEIAATKEFVSTLTPATFDWLRYRAPLNDDRNLLNRLSDLSDGIRRATAPEACREGMRGFDLLLRDIERLRGAEEIEAWFSTRDFDADGAAYWANLERFEREFEEHFAERRRRVAAFEAELRADWGEPDSWPADADERRRAIWSWFGLDPDVVLVEEAPGTKQGSEGQGNADLFTVPGLIGEFVDLCLATAPYPSRKLAFLAGLALSSVLTARKVRDSHDVRPNAFLLGVAPSGAGKDFPRRAAKAVLKAAGMLELVIENVASAQGLEDALVVQPALLLLQDEADALIGPMSDRKDPRADQIRATLLSLYASSSSTWAQRVKAGEGPRVVVDQPSLTVLMNAIPKSFFGALSEKLLTDGLASRLIVVEANEPRVGQDARPIVVPESLVEVAAYWRDFVPVGNDLNRLHPGPLTVLSATEAEALLKALRTECDRRYNAAIAAGEDGEATIHARTYEKARKLALLYACSERREAPRISRAAAEWAIAFARQQADWQLSLIARYGPSSPFEQGCRRVVDLLSRAPGRKLSRAILLKATKASSKQLEEWTRTLLEREEIELKVVSTRGRPAAVYFLR